MKVVSAARMAALDRRTIEESGLPGAVLMETAGRAVARVCLECFPEARRFRILCGPGNNGGDGFVAGRTLARWGREVDLLLLGSTARLKGDAALHAGVARAAGLSIREVETEDAVESGGGAPDVLIDALFGTGLKRDLQGLPAAAAAGMNRSGLPVVAVDIPSGVCSDTGRLLGVAVEARVTVTMGLPKVGLLLHPGAGHVGDLWVAEIGFPLAELAAAELPGEVLTGPVVRDLLPLRPPTAHKGSCGSVLVVAGSERYTGAPSLAGEAALRSGAGLLFLACPASIRPLLVGSLREGIFLPLPSPRGFLEPSDLEHLLPPPDRTRSLCLGPGLGGEPETHEAIRGILAKSRLPVVIDADALRAVAGSGPLAARAVLTPHPGEAAALMGTTVQEIESDRVGWALRCARAYGAVVVLKGAPTIIADSGGERFWINTTGGPVLSQGGTGDVLAGAAAGLLAQGLGPREAACCAVFLHGLAGDLCAAALGPRGVLAGDIGKALPGALEKVLCGGGPASTIREVL